MSELILVSTSAYRRSLLARLGLPFRALAPRVDEEALKDPRWCPRELAERLAEAKARSLLEAEPGATLLGSDQVVELEGQALGKPGGAERAVEQLAAMSGRTHTLITAVAVLHRGTIHRHTDVTTLRMRPLGRGEIERYVAADHPFDCAGSYKIEERGITLFESIETDDHTAITGLPLIAITTILRQLGYPVP